MHLHMDRVRLGCVELNKYTYYNYFYLILYCIRSASFSAYVSFYLIKITSFSLFVEVSMVQVSFPY